MATIQTVSSLADEQIDDLTNLLLPLDAQIKQRVNHCINEYHLKKSQALEYVVMDNPILWAKVYLDWNTRDYQHDIILECKKSNKTVLRLGRRLGKCLTGDTLIPDSNTGEYIPLKELYDRQYANIYALSKDNYSLQHTDTNIIMDNGIKPVYKITTVSGREITATGNHPFYTLQGFVELDKLDIDDYIGIAKSMQPTNPVHIDDNVIKLLAYMIGDGTTTNPSNIRFSCDTIDVKILKEMKEICNSLGCDFFQYNSDGKYNYHICGIKDKTTNKRCKNHISDILKHYNLIGKNANTKEIPSEIFRLDNEQLALFISRLYATDGWVTLSLKAKPRVEIGYSSNSKKLISQLQSLLLRFGINSILAKKNVKYNGTIRHSYVLGIYSKEDCLLFINQIGIYDKDNAINKVKDVLDMMTSSERFIPSYINTIIEEELIKYNITRNELRKATDYRTRFPYNSVSYRKVCKANEYIKSSRIDNILKSDVIWDKIKSIEYIGEQKTYDFTVPYYHNFVANDFIVHNSECMCVIILWFACTQYNKGDNNQYDILIATPYDPQVDLIFKRLHQLLDRSPLLQSLVSRDVHHNLCLDINGVTSSILGLTAGANNSSNGANSSRGQRADNAY